MNNRAAEAFVQGRLDDAYWWARAAIGQDPRFLSAYNTLGIIYHHHGNLAEAEKAFAYVLEREPANTRAMSNLVRLLDDMGRTAEATVLAARLEQLEPNPPFSYFNRGMQALRDGNLGSGKGPLRQGNRSRALLPRIQVLARDRLPEPWQRRSSAQGAHPRKGICDHP